MTTDDDTLEIIKAELREIFDEMYGAKTTEQTKLDFKNALAVKFKNWEDRGLIESLWEPRFHVEQSKNNPNKVTIVPDDCETAMWFLDIYDSRY